MNCHYLKDCDALIFWGQKCGATCLKEIIIHLESGCFFDNSGKDEVTHNIYNQFYKQDLNFSLNFFRDTSVYFFGRNPYSRIVSLFIDKYVALNSPTPKIDYHTKCFSEFIKFIYAKSFTSNDSKQSIFSGFFPITLSNNFNLFKRLTDFQSAKVYIMDEFILPDGKLLYSPSIFNDLYKSLKKTTEYISIQKYIEHKWTVKQQSQNKQSAKPVFDNSDLCHMNQSELREILTQYSVYPSSFFSNEIKNMFDIVYKEELDFFWKILKHIL